MTRLFGSAIFAVVLLLGAGAPPVQAASSLSPSQISAILGLLQAFGADAAVIANVNSVLGGTTTTTTINPPTITKIGWAPGSSVASSTISIIGTNLKDTTRVDFYSATTGKLVGSLTDTYTASQRYIHSSDSTVSVYPISSAFPANLTGALLVYVVTPSGTSNALPFSFSTSISTTTAPTITQVSWNAGVSSVASSSVSIRGTNLKGATGVYFNNILASVQYSGSNSDLAIYSSSPGNSFIENLNGTYQVRVVTPSGTSNALSLSVITTHTTSTMPDVEFIGTPTLNLNYDSSGKETILLANATVKVTTGSSPVNPSSLGWILQFYRNGYGAVQANSIRFGAVGSVVGTIPANTTATYTITNAVPAKELFAGAYTLSLSQFSYTNGSNNNYLTVQPTSFVNISSNSNSVITGANTVTIIGEVSPYISSVAGNSTGTVVIQGVRLNSSGSTILFNGTTRSYTAFGSNGDGFINFKPVDFGITTSGSYPVQITNSSVGNSNIVWLNYTAGTQTPAPSASISASPSTVVSGSSATLSWSSTNATSCAISGPPPASVPSWSVFGNTSGSGSTGPLTSTITYNLKCTGASGTAYQSVTITVTPKPTASALSAVEGLNNSTSQSQSSFSYVWNTNLQIGSSNSADVTALQTALTNEGVYTGEITGGFYNQTFTAVKAFQQKYGINATGFVGPVTREKLNSLY